MEQRDPRVEAALAKLKAGAHDAWITLHPVGEEEQRKLVAEMIEVAYDADPDGCFW